MNKKTVLMPKEYGIMSRISRFFSKQIRKVDNFGYPVSLTYKNQQTYKSFFGGCMTILSALALLIYLSFMILKVT